MDLFATPSGGNVRAVLGGIRLGLGALLVGAMALTGGSGGASPSATPTPTVAPTPDPTPSPEPTPEPTPEVPDQIAEEHVREAQQRLVDLGYWVGGGVDGELGGGTRHALTAFQKVEGLPRDGELTPDLLLRLRSASRPAARVTGYAHWEADLNRQVLWHVDASGAVSRILPISSGHGRAFTSQGWTRRAITPRGIFRVQRKIAGWRISPLGKLYYPSYLIGGIAVHGAPSVPAHPASSGCIRVPMFAAKAVSDLMPVGTTVIVHDGGPLVQERDTASPPGLDTPDASEPTTPDEPEPTPEPTAEPTPEPRMTPRPPRTPDPIPTSSPPPAPTPTPEASPAPEG